MSRELRQNQGMAIHDETERKLNCGNTEGAFGEIFSILHRKVSIQDAQSCFGSGQIPPRSYPACFSRTFQTHLEAQAHGLLHRLGSVEDKFPIREIS
jgi:hypothetical protein